MMFVSYSRPFSFFFLSFNNVHTYIELRTSIRFATEFMNEFNGIHCPGYKKVRIHLAERRRRVRKVVSFNAGQGSGVRTSFSSPEMEGPSAPALLVASPITDWRRDGFMSA